MARRVVAELIGTFVLVFFAVGSAVFGYNDIGPLGVALCFGLVLLALAYAIGPISGAHVNPAVTLGVLLARKIRVAEAGLYVLAQVLGAIAGAALLKSLTGFGHVVDQTGGPGTNTWGKHISGPGAFVLEVVLTALLVLVVLLVTSDTGAPGFAGLAIGLTLTVVHLVGITLDSTSVNSRAPSGRPCSKAAPRCLSCGCSSSPPGRVGGRVRLKRALRTPPEPGSGQQQATDPTSAAPAAAGA